MRPGTTATNKTLGLAPGAPSPAESFSAELGKIRLNGKIQYYFAIYQNFGTAFGRIHWGQYRPNLLK
jgi:hypothetical protein